MKLYDHNIKLTALCAAAFGMISATTEATSIPSDLAIDFRDHSWSGANGQYSYQVGGVKAIANPLCRALFQDGRDGLGIRGGEHDEIDRREMLVVAFRGGSGSDLMGVWLTDLFNNHREVERGYYQIYSNGSWGSWNGVTASNSHPNGEQYVSFGGPTDVRRIRFKAPMDGMSEFSVAGFKKAVPDSGMTLLLLGAGLLLVGGAGRCKKALS